MRALLLSAALAAAAAPPAAAGPGDGEYFVGPDYSADPDLADHGRPSGRYFELSMPLAGSNSSFNGSDPTLDPQQPPNKERRIFVYVPSAYNDGAPAPLLVIQDGVSANATPLPGWGAMNRLMRMTMNAQDNLAAPRDPGRRLPAFVTVGVENGGGSERNLEYDTMSDRYARFVQHEVLPAVLGDASVRAAYPRLAFTQDPWSRATLGCSSGGSVALTMGYFRPDLFRRIAAYSISAVNLQDPRLPEATPYPQGAWEYHSGMKLIEDGDKRPLRVFASCSEHDLGWAGNCSPGVNSSTQGGACWGPTDGVPAGSGSFRDGRHNWVVAGNRTAAALRRKGYAYRHVYALNATECGGWDGEDRNLWTQTLADTLVWLWRDHKG